MEPYTKTIQAGGDASAGPVKITLVWTDFPGDPAASVALVNDLDLVASASGGGAVYRGNNIDPVSGLSLAGGVADQLNNVEMIVLPADTSGEFVVRIEPTLIVESPQGFALVVSGDVGEESVSSATVWWMY